MERRDNTEILAALARVEYAVARVEERQVATASVVEKLDHRLYGNGQKGDIEKIEGRVEAIEMNHQKVTGWLAGALAVFTVLGGAFEFLWHNLFSKKP